MANDCHLSLSSESIIGFVGFYFCIFHIYLVHQKLIPENQVQVVY